MKTIVLDTNLLILLVVGETSLPYISKHKRLKAFTISDYYLLISLLIQAASIRVTPNTLTETSNLLKHIDEPARTRIFRKFVEIVKKLNETYIESRATLYLTGPTASH